MEAQPSPAGCGAPAQRRFSAVAQAQAGAPGPQPLSTSTTPRPLPFIPQPSLHPDASCASCKCCRLTPTGLQARRAACRPAARRRRPAGLAGWLWQAKLILAVGC
eukprot:350687-Chlamydomonas_euryale.AAC.3